MRSSSMALGGAVLAGACALLACDLPATCYPWRIIEGMATAQSINGGNCLAPTLGGECSANAAVTKRVTVRANSNDVVSDPQFDHCDYFLCASTNGSRPYCTRRCETLIDCDPGGLPCLPGQ